VETARVATEGPRGGGGKLVELGADVRMQVGVENRPLHLAAHWEEVQVVTKLMALGADVKGKIADGASPLHRAAYVWHVGMVATLLQLETACRLLVSVARCRGGA
jgi:ankyrin repeat protein